MMERKVGTRLRGGLLESGICIIYADFPVPTLSRVNAGEMRKYLGGEAKSLLYPEAAS